MSTYSTNRAIDLEQLSTELGDIGFRFEVDGVASIITADIDEATLKAVVDAHEPAPPAPSDAEAIANLKARLASTEQTLDQIIIDALMGDFPPA